MHDLAHRVRPQCPKGMQFHALVNSKASRDFHVEANTELRLQHALQRGILHHRNGRLEQVNPKHADALHLVAHREAS
uniref:Uncharacterized protein n=1 Tax=Globisporangium ultimum (strain ATCC 200006 / CBS 805.95 / DAOM BR144) TaxID=431595 RepID=K3WAB4_GLOUD